MAIFGGFPRVSNDSMGAVFDVHKRRKGADLLGLGWFSVNVGFAYS